MLEAVAKKPMPEGFPVEEFRTLVNVEDFEALMTVIEFLGESEEDSALLIRAAELFLQINIVVPTKRAAVKSQPVEQPTPEQFLSMIRAIGVKKLSAQQGGENKWVTILIADEFFTESLRILLEEEYSLPIAPIKD